MVFAVCFGHWKFVIEFNSIFTQETPNPKILTCFFTILTMHREYLKCDRSKKESYWCNGFMHFTKILGLFLILSSKVKSVWLNSAVNFFCSGCTKNQNCNFSTNTTTVSSSRHTRALCILKMYFSGPFCVCFRSLIGQISYWFIIVLVLRLTFLMWYFHKVIQYI